MAQRIAAAAIALGLLPTLASAQSFSRSQAAQAPQSGVGNSNSSPLIGGIKGAFNVAHLVENTEGLDSVTGLIIGGFVRRSVRDSFALQPEFLFSQQGAAFRRDSLRINYLQVPVLGVALFARPTATPFVVAGPSIGIKLGATVSSGSRTEDVGDEVAGADFSFIIGGGVEMNRLSFEARFSAGLTDIDPGRDIGKNRVFSVLIGYRLR